MRVPEIHITHSMYFIIRHVFVIDHHPFSPSSFSDRARHHASREFSDSDQRSRRASYQAKETLQCFSMAGVQISAFSFAQRQAHRSRTRVSGLR